MWTSMCGVKKMRDELTTVEPWKAWKALPATDTCQSGPPKASEGAEEPAVAPGGFLDPCISRFRGGSDVAREIPKPPKATTTTKTTRRRLATSPSHAVSEYSMGYTDKVLLRSFSRLHHVLGFRANERSRGRQRTTVLPPRRSKQAFAKNAYLSILTDLDLYCVFGPISMM